MIWLETTVAKNARTLRPYVTSPTDSSRPAHFIHVEKGSLLRDLLFYEDLEERFKIETIRLPV